MTAPIVVVPLTPPSRTLNTGGSRGRKHSHEQVVGAQSSASAVCWRALARGRHGAGRRLRHAVCAPCSVELEAARAACLPASELALSQAGPRARCVGPSWRSPAPRRAILKVAVLARAGGRSSSLASELILARAAPFLDTRRAVSPVLARRRGSLTRARPHRTRQRAPPSSPPLEFAPPSPCRRWRSLPRARTAAGGRSPEPAEAKDEDKDDDALPARPLAPSALARALRHSAMAGASGRSNTSPGTRRGRRRGCLHGHGRQRQREARPGWRLGCLGLRLCWPGLGQARGGPDWACGWAVGVVILFRELYLTDMWGPGYPWSPHGDDFIPIPAP